MDRYGLIVNNNTVYLTRSSSQEISIMNLALTMTSLRPFMLWEISKEYLSVSNHELILLQWENLRQNKNQSKSGINTG